MNKKILNEMDDFIKKVSELFIFTVAMLVNSSTKKERRKAGNQIIKNFRYLVTEIIICLGFIIVVGTVATIVIIIAKSTAIVKSSQVHGQFVNVLSLLPLLRTRK